MPACMRYISGSQRAQSHRAPEILDGAVAIALPDSQETAEEPGGRQIWIEHQRPVEQGDAAIEVAGEMGERMAASRQRDGVVAAEFDGPAGEARALGGLPWHRSSSH